MKGHVAGFFAGVLFATGLVVSGMTQPQKIVSFLDVTGAWDPSLALVMVGAIGVHAVLLRVIGRRTTPVFAPAFKAHPAPALDGSLLAGAAIFGLGWGLAGYCPGPAFVAAGALQPNALAFLAAMSLGVVGYRFVHQRRRERFALDGRSGGESNRP